MKHFFITVLLSTACLSAFCQAKNKLSAYVLGQYNKTLYDYTAGNNPWGVGLGVQASYINKTKFRPVVELTGDIYFADDKVLRSNPDGSFPTSDNDVSSMVNPLAGVSYHPNSSLYFSLLAGPSFIGGNTYTAIKPSIGFFLSKNQKWTARLSYINVFNRTKIVNDDFGSLSMSIGLRIF